MNTCQCVDCGGTEPGHSKDCLYMHELHFGGNQLPSDNLMLDASGPQCDIKLETMRINGKMVICTPEYPIYLTKEQAMAFFNLVEKV